MADGNAQIQGIEFEIRGSADKASSGLLRFAKTLRVADASAAKLGKLRKLAADLRGVSDALGSVNGSGLLSLSATLEEIGSHETQIGKVVQHMTALSALDFSKLTAAANALGQISQSNIGAATGAPSASASSSETRDANAQLATQSHRLRDLNKSVRGMRSAWTDLRGAVRAYVNNTDMDVNDLQRRLETFNPFKYAAATMFQPITAGLAALEDQFNQSGVSIGGFFRNFASEERIASENSTNFVQGLDAVRLGLGGILDAGLNAAEGVGSFALGIGGGLLSALKSAASRFLAFNANLAKIPFKSASDGAKKLSSKINTVASSFKRILFYRVIRTVIKEIGQALKEGTENAYWYSKNIGESTRYISEAYDAFRSASYKMGNQLGAAWATAFAQIVPIINSIIALVTRAAAVVTQFFSVLGGKTTYMQAIDYSKDWAEATKAGGKAAKEWKNQLMGFDEINRLEEPSQGGGGAGADIPDYQNMFREADVESPIADFASRLKDAIKSSDWQGVGDLLGSKINSIFPTAGKWEEWGGKFGSGIKGLVNSAYYTMKATDFSMMGTRIAGFVNSALANALSDDGGGSAAENFGRLLVRRITAGFDFLIAFLRDLDWGRVSGGIADFFRGATDEAADWISAQDWGNIGSTLYKKLQALVGGIDYVSLATSVFRFFGVQLGAAAKLIFTFLGSAFEDVKKYFQDEAAKWGGSMFTGLVVGVTQAFLRVAQFVYDHIVRPVIDGVKEGWGINSPSTVFAEIGGYLIDGLWNGVRERWERFIGFFQGLWDNLKSWWSSLSLGAFHIPHPVFEWTYSEAGGALAKALEFVGLPPSIPHLNISWAARGGIVDGATLIGAGEAGKEAIIPLERNTEWISKVAREMNAQQARQSVGYNADDIGAALEDANDGVINAILSVGAQVISAMAENSRSGDIDWRAVSQQVTKYQRQMARAGG